MMFDLIETFDEFLIINKPAGIEFHGDLGILSLLREKFKEVHGIHRLDKATSGLMIFARTKRMQSVFSQLFEAKKIQKTYIAISDKKPKKKQGRIKGDIIKSRGGSYQLARTLDNPSITDFTSNFLIEHSLREFKLMPKTGKTHQLRVMMKSLGAPILGDKRYGGSDGVRMFLHASMLEFDLEGEKYFFENKPNWESLYKTDE